MLQRLLSAILFLSSFVVPSQCQSSLDTGEHNVVLNGVRLWYKVAGQAQPGQAPLVFLHGGPGYNSYSFEKTVGSRLESHAQVIYLDERGSGRSERPWTKEYTLPTLGADVEALRSSLGVPQISLMGHSFGGTLALEYAAQYPSHVQKLIILDGAADLPAIFDLWQQEIEQRYPAAWQAALAGSYGKILQGAILDKDSCATAKGEFTVEMKALNHVDSGEFHNWQQFHDLRFQKEQEAMDKASGLGNSGELGNACLGPDSNFPCYQFSDYNKLTMPSLIIVGKYDGAIGAEQMRSLADHLPHARFDEFDRSGHFVYAEEPEKFEHDVASFLAEK